jgi:hypothetical protein
VKFSKHSYSMMRLFLAPAIGGSTGICRAALLLAIVGTGFTSKADQSLLLPAPQGAEQNSPSEATPGLFEPGLGKRAVPSAPPPPDRPELDLESFYWDTHPFENAALMQSAAIPVLGEPFRPVTTYAPPLGLRPKVYRQGILEFYPWAGISQSFDSNVKLTQTNQISDFFVTPEFGMELQVGSPDSTYIESYETIVAAHLSYEGYADVFYEHPDLSAYNSLLDFNGRIGRDRLIVRPFLKFSDTTGNNLQLLQLQDRIRRLQTYAGTVGEYAITPITTWRQAYSVLDFQHTVFTNQVYGTTNINYITWSTRQELSYLLGNNAARAILWLGAEATDPDKGYSGNEYLAGVGWQGAFGERVYSELHIGWGELQLNGPDRQPVDGNPAAKRWDMSGIRYGGYTTFDWTERLRLTLLYDRDYVYNENAPNDNYVTTMTQFKAEIYMGDNWLLIPYLGTSFDEFQLSHRLEVDLRPEVELARIFGREAYQIIGLEDKSVASRVFIKFGYDYTTNLRGIASTIQGVRVSTGFNWNF